MANYKKRRQRGARAGCSLCRPWKIHNAPPDSKLRASELRRLGGKRRRFTKRVVADE